MPKCQWRGRQIEASTYLSAYEVFKNIRLKSCEYILRDCFIRLSEFLEAFACGQLSVSFIRQSDLMLTFENCSRLSFVSIASSVLEEPRAVVICSNHLLNSQSITFADIRSSCLGMSSNPFGDDATTAIPEDIHLEFEKNQKGDKDRDDDNDKDHHDDDDDDYDDDNSSSCETHHSRCQSRRCGQSMSVMSLRFQRMTQACT